MSRRHIVVILALGHGLIACERLPFSPSGDAYLRGFVQDTVSRPVPGAVVEILDGPRAGARTTSDSGGAFAFDGGRSGTATVRASRHGFLAATATATWSTNPNERTAIRLKPLEASLEILPGEYTMTLISDPGATGWAGATCAGFPPDLLHRTYDATISPATNFDGFHIRYTSPTLLRLPEPFGFGFGLTLAGQFVGFELEIGFGSGPTEELPDHRYLMISGVAPTLEPATVNDGALILPFGGGFQYCRLTSPLGGHNTCDQVPAAQRLEFHACASMHDRMVLSRR
jgi:hypothetical protein